MSAEVSVRTLSGNDVAPLSQSDILMSELKTKLAPEFHNVRFYVGQEELQGDGCDLPAGTEIWAVVVPCKSDALKAASECALAFEGMVFYNPCFVPAIVSAESARKALALCARASCALKVLSGTGDWSFHERLALVNVMMSSMAQWHDEDLVKNLVSALVSAYGEDPQNCIPDFIWEAVQAKALRSRTIALAVLESLDPRQQVVRKPISARDIPLEERQAYCELLGRYGTPDMDLLRLRKLSADAHVSGNVSRAATEALAQIMERCQDKRPADVDAMQCRGKRTS